MVLLAGTLRAFVWLLICVKVIAELTPLDAYLEREEPEYRWFDTGERLRGISGTHITVLNVTSLQWLNRTHIYGEFGSVWTHQVAVVTPTKKTPRETALALITGRCNREPGK